MWPAVCKLRKVDSDRMWWGLATATWRIVSLGETEKMKRTGCPSPIRGERSRKTMLLAADVEHLLFVSSGHCASDAAK